MSEASPASCGLAGSAQWSAERHPTAPDCKRAHLVIYPRSGIHSRGSLCPRRPRDASAAPSRCSGDRPQRTTGGQRHKVGATHARGPWSVCNRHVSNRHVCNRHVTTSCSAADHADHTAACRMQRVCGTTGAPRGTDCMDLDTQDIDTLPHKTSAKPFLPAKGNKEGQVAADAV